MTNQDYVATGMPQRWFSAVCPVCNNIFPYREDYRPQTCGRFECLQEAERRGLLELGGTGTGQINLHVSYQREQEEEEMSEESILGQLHKQFPHGHPDFNVLCVQEMELHSTKNYEYAAGGDPLGNFYRVAAIKALYPDMDWATPLGTCLANMLKQLDAAFHMIEGEYEGQVETVDSRLADVHVYAKLARILYKEAS